ncbi:myocardial zonula adherens protein [Microcaecilia unicolor]|uniref:Myocardial zonula adherens protein-like n=1 Tax=Microcaecilia unicolor TaxID=1415580 RepID=A0A6P7XAC6_9AMPH|nr:myocardial zonula adherens protein-like [Microcaecilia unicolor]
MAEREIASLATLTSREINSGIGAGVLLLVRCGGQRKGERRKSCSAEVLVPHSSSDRLCITAIYEKNNNKSAKHWVVAAQNDRYNSATTFALTTSETQETPRKGNICRLRLTVPPDEVSHSEIKNERTEKAETTNTAARRRRKNGLLHSEKKATQQPALHLYSMPKEGSPDVASHGVMYGVVHRPDDGLQNEVVVYEWSTHQLKEEMNYIKDVRETLEKIRERMYGEYDDMKLKIKELTREMKIASAKQESWQSHSQVQSAALDSFGEMNSSLTAVAVDLQKTLVDMTLENGDIRDEIKSLKNSYEESLDELKEKQKLLEAAQVENQLLKLKVEYSQEANAEVMRDMTRKLYNQYEAKLQEQQLKHEAEKESLQAQTSKYLKAIEEANEKIQFAEARIGERDQRIGELDRLIFHMDEERQHLLVQLSQYEEQMHSLEAEPQSNDVDKERSQHLEEAAVSLRERIKHLDDMVHCQQKKVKNMVEEVEILRTRIHHKDLLIQQLLERVAFLEGENNELQDKLDYFRGLHSKSDIETQDIGISCDLTKSDLPEDLSGSHTDPVDLREDLPTSPTAPVTSGQSTTNGTWEFSSPTQRAETPYMRILQLNVKNIVS